MPKVVEKLRRYGIARSLRYFIWHLKMGFNRVFRGSYSQLGEDLVIDRLLGHKDKGFYIDIGANHPRISNNTKRFSARGWRGINVEPDPEAFGKLQRDRKNDINLNLGIGTGRAAVPFFRFHATNLSTFSSEKAQRWQSKGFELKDSRLVDIRTLSEILEEHHPTGSIDIMSVDTEGWEMEVLKSNDWSRFVPGLICIETSTAQSGEGPPGQRAEITRFLREVGYVDVYENQLNTIFVLPPCR
jgi:FkbM family methyltransferase